MDYTDEIIGVLERAAAGGEKFVLVEGLSEQELSRAEEMYKFHFPPDLRALLSQVLPLDIPNREIRSYNDRQRLPDWRNVPNEYIQNYMDWPFNMLIGSVRRGWRFPNWTKEPQEGEDLEAMTRATLDSLPTLIPVYSHRFLPATPYESGNPVFSMFGTDTIIYGTDLLSYFCSEFEIDNPRSDEPELKHIPFWNALAGIE